MGRTVRKEANQEPEEQTQAVPNGIADPPRAEGLPLSHTHTRSDLVEQVPEPSGSAPYRNTISEEHVGTAHGRMEEQEWPALGDWNGVSAMLMSLLSRRDGLFRGPCFLFRSLVVPVRAVSPIPWEGSSWTPRGFLFRLRDEIRLQLLMSLMATMMAMTMMRTTRTISR